MWGLTKNIYRFTPAMVVENLNQHTVDEVSQLFTACLLKLIHQRISLEGHLNTTKYYYKLLQNLEGWSDKSKTQTTISL
jgi:Gly-Xaa carboxypeptidase